MKTEWDYTHLANAYLKRPDYAIEAIEKMLSIAAVKKNDRACDIGAGAAHLTILLAKNGLRVNAVEPNDAMRNNGIKRTNEYKNVVWFEGVGEHTGQPTESFELVTFGSSFNVTNQQEALTESHRLLVKGGWFACMWNHRDLSDGLQQKIENIIKSYVKDFNYGSRREDQTEIIRASDKFDHIQSFEGKVMHRVPVDDFIEGWRSHGTVHRQAKDCFDAIMKDIEILLHANGKKTIIVPYVTKIWMARVIK